MKGSEQKISRLYRVKIFSLLIFCVCLFSSELSSVRLQAAEFTNIGSVRFEGEGEVGTSDRVLRFFLSATLRGTNEDTCRGQDQQTICTDFVRAYLTDNENKILGSSVIDILKGNVRSGDIRIALENKSFTFPYKIILTDIIDPEDGKEIGDVYEDDKTSATPDIVRSFDPTKLDGNKPEDWQEDAFNPGGNRSGSTEPLPGGPIIVDVGALRIFERAPVQPEVIDVGELRINEQGGAPPIEIDVGALRINELGPEPPQSVDIGGLRIVERGEETDRTLSIGDLKIIERGTEPDRRVEIGNLRINERGVEPPRVVNIGRLKIVERGAEHDRTLGIGALRIIERGVEPNRTLNIGRLSVVERGNEPDRSVNVGRLRIIEQTGLAPPRPDTSNRQPVPPTDNTQDPVSNASEGQEQPIEIDGLRIVGREGVSAQGDIEIRGLRIVGREGVSAQGDIEIRGLRIVGREGVSAQGDIEIRGLRIVGREGVSAQGDIEIDGLRIVGREGVSAQGDIEIDGLRIVGREGVSGQGDIEIDAGELEVIGVATERKLKINAGTLRVIGTRPRVPNFIQPGALPGRVKVSVIRVRKLSGETNPFDPVELEADITAAQNGTLGGGGGNATALTVAGVPFNDLNQIFVNLDAAGTALSADNVGATQALDIQSTGAVMNIVVSPGFTEVSSNGSLADPGGGVPGTFARQIVVRRNGDGVHFQLNVNLTTTFVDVTLNTLTGFNCGTSAGNCP